MVELIEIKYGIISSDHLSLVAQIQLPPDCICATPSVESGSAPTYRTQWEKLSQGQLASYGDSTKETIAFIRFGHE